LDFLSFDALDHWITQGTNKSTSSSYCDDKAFQQGQANQSLGHYLDSEIILTLSTKLSSDFHLRTALREREYALDNHLLLTLPFRTVDQYLDLLQLSSSLLKPCGRMACIYLAAAVSDFTIADKSVHKLQSSSILSDDGTLTLHLQPVPKRISALRKEWAPQAFVTSFKLETQQELLEPMARRAIDKYDVHLVCANLLHTRNEWVWMIPSSSICLMDNKRASLQQPNGCKTMSKVDVLSIKKHRPPRSHDCHADDLEEQIVLYVTQRHFDYISMGGMEESGMNTAAVHLWKSLEQRFTERQRHLKRQLWWNRAKEFTMQLCGSAVGLLFSYWISSLIYQRNNAQSNSHQRRLYLGND
jgi:hypothetical protein